MKILRFLKGIILNGLLYSVVASALVWLLIFAIALYRYHYLGHTPDHIRWLTPHIMSLAKALDKSAYIANVAAIITVGTGLALTALFNIVIGLVMLLAIAILKTRHHETLGQHAKLL
jgi:small-conductance mechanosensitive channel